MEERDAVFRSRLVTVMTALNGGEAKDPALRKLVGGYAQRLAKQVGAKNWADLKRRLDAPTYNSMLTLFEKQSGEFHKVGDSKGVRALETLALSLIARHQKQGDLLPGVVFLDTYIEQCASANKRVRTVVVSTRPAAH